MNRLQKDFTAIEKSMIMYLNKNYSVMEMLHNIEMLANATFNSEHTKKFYNFLMEFIGNVEEEYFMNTDFPTNDQEINYNQNIISMVRKYFEELQKYKTRKNM